jgi:hypothetical protein
MSSAGREPTLPTGAPDMVVCWPGRRVRATFGQGCEGYHATALPPMPEIATKLSENDIEALASYLSFVK